LVNHLKYIKQCYKLARKGAGKVSPNPLVGSILVKNGKVIGKGWHKKIGKAHAEVNAIKNAKENVSGSTLYCNLEPCCHTNKKTPPCVPFIIKSKIKKIVISNLDPNPDVNGKGVEQLNEAGIEVITGVLMDEGNEINKFYFKFVKEKLPYITLKIAQSVDGKISLSNKEQIWLTGKESTKYVHKLRSKYDAVLVGAGTIRTDNPLLTVREVKGRNPKRIIIDGKLSIPANSNVIKNTRIIETIIFTSTASNKKMIEVMSGKGANIVQLKPNKNKRLNFEDVLRELAQKKISSVLVEGGSEIFNQFIVKELFDELIILQSPKILGKGIGYYNFKKMKNLQLTDVEKLGNDIKLIYRRNNALKL
jgi:diaminohydroxyphosphoribosylaminopyrimidine deaminase/5-amino-6-(5-phosphoribosylamino)uracil reductase